jgi:hypothetical protein
MYFNLYKNNQLIKEFGKNIITNFFDLYAFGLKKFEQLPISLQNDGSAIDNKKKSNILSFIICFTGLQGSYLTWLRY